MYVFVWTGGNCKARWNNIRDNFRKSLSKRRTTSGQAVKKVKPYRFESQLHFLLEYMEERETKGNIERRPETEYTELGNDDDEGQEPLQTTDIPSTTEVSKQPVSQSFTLHNPTSSNDTPSSTATTFAKPSKKRNIQPETAASTLMKYILEKRKKRQNQAQVDYPP